MTPAEKFGLIVGGGIVFSLVVDLIWVMYLLYKGRWK